MWIGYWIPLNYGAVDRLQVHTNYPHFNKITCKNHLKMNILFVISSVHLNLFMPTKKGDT